MAMPSPHPGAWNLRHGCGGWGWTAGVIRPRRVKDTA
ncbi:hypothetical protein amrb99_14910 [Actinomadura sp. RB99]|nr:hypothetical protein [Actinomadura sp. RB99]